MKPHTTVITFATFDVLHVGHIRLLRRARDLGTRLVVGVSSDELNLRKKGRAPVFDQSERMEILANLRCLDTVFLEESLELKRHYVLAERAEVLIIGHDLEGRLDHVARDCQVGY